jgi:ribosomal protein S18 acetylase RimI-like enzyme
MTIRRLKIGEADLYKTIRLTALKDAPDAFSSTYESALLRSQESWAEQADRSAEGADRATFLAFDHANPVAMAALYRYEKDTNAGELLQMWVYPDCRGGQIGTNLMDVVFKWASLNGFAEVRAEVIRTNQRALRFYEKYGFYSKHELTNGDTVVLIKKVDPFGAADLTSLGG